MDSHLRKTIRVLADVRVALEVTCRACGHRATIDAMRLVRRHGAKRLAEVPFRCSQSGCGSRMVDVQVIDREDVVVLNERVTHLRDFYRSGQELRITCTHCTPAREITLTVQDVEHLLNKVNPPMRMVLQQLACPRCNHRGFIGAAAVDTTGPARRVQMPGNH